MSTLKLRGALGVALLTTLIAAWFAPAPQDGGLVLGPRVQQGAAAASAPARGAASADRSAGPVQVLPQVLRIRPRDENVTADAQLFASTQWTPPVQAARVVRAAPVEVVAAPPQAPPLPFRVLGRYEDAGQAAVFVQYNDQNLVVRVGDTLALQYKVERLSGTTLTLRYLPLDQLQTLEVGAAP